MFYLLFFRQNDIRTYFFFFSIKVLLLLRKSSTLKTGFYSLRLLFSLRMFFILQIMDSLCLFNRRNFDVVVSRGQNKKTTLQSSLLFVFWCVIF